MLLNGCNNLPFCVLGAPAGPTIPITVPLHAAKYPAASLFLRAQTVY